MLGWLSALRRGYGDDFYRPKERCIYSYWNGEKTVKTDPMVLYKRIVDNGPSLSIDNSLANSAAKDATKGHTSLIKKLREIFELKDFEHGGLTEKEVAELFDHFMLFCDNVKKNSSPSLISAPSSVPQNESQPIPSSLESGSTVKECSTDKPEPLPTESPSHLDCSNPDSTTIVQ